MQALHTSTPPKKKLPGGLAVVRFDPRGFHERPYSAHPRGREACLKRAPSPFSELATCCLMDWREGRQVSVRASTRNEIHAQPRGQATRDLNLRPVARRRD